jgi:hypothetical protein
LSGAAQIADEIKQQPFAGTLSRRQHADTGCIKRFESNVAPYRNHAFGKFRLARHVEDARLRAILLRQALNLRFHLLGGKGRWFGRLIGIDDGAIGRMQDRIGRVDLTARFLFGAVPVAPREPFE